MENITFTYNTSPFSVKFKKLTRDPLPFAQELIETAKYINTLTTKPIMLVLSGGIDGETTALSFLTAGIPFEVLTCNYKSRANYLDTKYAKEFCERHDIKQHFIELDDENFYFNKGYEKYIEQGYISNNLYNYLQLYLLEIVESMGCTAVCGGGDQTYKIENNTLCFKTDTPVINTLEWCKNNKTLHFPYFFITTPELTVSYMEDTLIKFFINNYDYYAGIQDFDYNMEKTILFHSIYPSMPKRRKYTGFEAIIDKRLREEAELKARFPEVKKVFIPLSTVREELGIK